tara:strand:- start:1037 stop:1807 length:771 start_codon:yes stop_codon:yes gene_type:complete
MSTYIANVARGGNYNEEVGLDIDGDIIGTTPDGNLYDYDLRSRPGVGVSGSGIIIPPELDDGFPSVDDYIVNPDGSKTLKKFIQGEGVSLGTMTESVNNGRLSDVKVVNDLSTLVEQDITMKHDNSESSIKGILEENSLNSLFFSDTNMKVIQDTLRYRVYKNTNQVISNQSPNDLYIIMRSIMLQYANFRVGIDNIIDEIKRLNEKVLDYSVENVTSNVKQHQGYIDDISNLPIPMDHPSYYNKGNYTYDISNLL